MFGEGLCFNYFIIYSIICVLNWWTTVKAEREIQILQINECSMWLLIQHHAPKKGFGKYLLNQNWADLHKNTLRSTSLSIKGQIYSWHYVTNQFNNTSDKSKPNGSWQLARKKSWLMNWKICINTPFICTYGMNMHNNQEMLHYLFCTSSVILSGIQFVSEIYQRTIVIICLEIHGYFMQWH